jgi:nicotinate-nucleotide pyrophosphorylase (carboxylating)
MILNKIDYLKLIDMALIEDVSDCDVTSEAILKNDVKRNAVIKAKQNGIVCGLDVVESVFLRVDTRLNVKKKVADGDTVKVGDVLLTIKGNVKSILTAERTALNFFSHLSGISTITNKFVKEVKGTNAKILDTRKTIPGLRMLEKYAVKMGGGENHRIGLWDAALIKENHIDAAGGIKAAIEKVRKFEREIDFVEIEVESLKQYEEALVNAPDIIMLDNMTNLDMLKAVEIKSNNNYNSILLEASGNISIDNIKEVALTGVDRISIGSITHSVKCFDMTLLLE